MTGSAPRHCLKPMSAHLKHVFVRPAVEAVLAAATVLLAGCTTAYDVQIVTPIAPKVDVAPFQRVLIAGFLTGGTPEVETNLETVRLLRSQLRQRSALQVIDAEVLPIAEIAADLAGAAGAADRGGDKDEPAPHGETRAATEEDLDAYEHVFANAGFWKRLGEEYQQPLIVTGTVVFTPLARSGVVTRDREEYDEFGRRRVVPVRTYQNREGFALTSTFVFIDGRTGATLYSATYREEILRSDQYGAPALSTYFELMDRLLPSLVGALTRQNVRGSRVLLK